MEFLTEYGMFLAKFATVFIFFIIVFFLAFMLMHKSKSMAEGHLEIRHLNQKFDEMNLLLKSQILPKKELKKSLKEFKQKLKSKDKKKKEEIAKKRIFVLDFKGDIRATAVHSLREEITALLTLAEAGKDEVLVMLESAGGTVHGYGLAASQLKRIRDRNIQLTVAVDKVAASGGYMMACVANKIIAAPFAIIGSIGVLAQLPNFHRFLKKHNIDFEQLAAGEYKRTLTLFGENTDEDRKKLQQELEETHDLFKDFIKENREQVEIDNISTGEHWYGKKALELKLVDELSTSDDYLTASADSSDIYEIRYERKKSVSEKLFSIGARLTDNFS